MVTIEELKIQTCSIMRDFYAEKILTDIGGNLSFRESEEEFAWITPTGKQKNLVKPEDLIKIDFKGNIIQDTSGRGSSVETPMHLAIYNEDEDFQVIIHSHAPYATAYSVLENPPEIPVLTAELAYLIPEVILVPYVQSGSDKLGEAVAETLLECGVVILENHGVVAAAESFQKAAQKTRALEECLKIYILANQYNRPIRPFQGFNNF